MQCAMISYLSPTHRRPQTSRVSRVSLRCLSTTLSQCKLEGLRFPRTKLCRLSEAHFLRDAKFAKFGTGCSESITSPEVGLGVCMIGEARSRVWCPNGKVYERDGTLPDFSLIRSICGLNQIVP
jgi:hypothetical protein